MGSKRMIGVFNYEENGLTYGEKEALGKSELEQCDVDAYRWDFLRRMKDKEICGYTSFEVYEHGYYFVHKCDDCGFEFNLPHQKKYCIKCKSERIQSGRKGVGQCGPIKGVTGLYDGVNPELYASAVQDLKEHPVPQAAPLEPDWGYLEKNI